MQHSTNAPTKNEEKRFRALHELGCIACYLRDVFADAEIHHLVDKGTRKHSGGHKATIPLCTWHHRGEHPIALSAKYMEEVLGPSMAKNKRAFIKEFGTERELLAKVDQMIARRSAA